MSKLIKSICTAIFIALLLSSIMFSPAFGLELVSPVHGKLFYSEVPLYSNDTLLGYGILINGTTFVPLLTFTEALLQESCDVDWNQETGTVILTSEVLTITLTLDNGFMEANGRYIYFENGALNINGTIVVPVRELAKVFGVKICWDEKNWSVVIDTSNLNILDPGDAFYDTDTLYWLSHVIYSEAGNQPLEGMIGVGNVVLNRALDESGLFGDGIQGVIFMPGQFDVVAAGTIYLEPSYTSVVAAKLCMEGYNTVGESKWFVNPAIGTTNWFKTYKTFTVAIADHDFYA